MKVDDRVIVNDLVTVCIYQNKVSNAAINHTTSMIFYLKDLFVFVGQNLIGLFRFRVLNSCMNNKS